MANLWSAWNSSQGLYDLVLQRSRNFIGMGMTMAMELMIKLHIGKVPEGVYLGFAGARRAGLAVLS